MNVYKLTTGDAVQEINFPTGYHELTFGQLLRLRLDFTGDVGQLLEILTNIPRAIWMGLPENQYGKIMGFLQWIADSLMKWEELPLPASLTINGQAYTVPKDLGFESFGQKIVLEAKLTPIIGSMFKPGAKAGNIKTPADVQRAAQLKNNSALISLMPYAVAVYFQPKVDGVAFDETKVLAVEQMVLNSRAVEVYPIGAFFIRNLLGLRKSGAQPSPVKAQKVKAGKHRKGRVLKKSKKKRGTS